MLKQKMRKTVLYVTVSQHDLGVFGGAKRLGVFGSSWAKLGQQFGLKVYHKQPKQKTAIVLFKTQPKRLRLTCHLPRFLLVINVVLLDI